MQLDERGVVLVDLHEFMQGDGCRVENHKERYSGREIAERAISAIGSKEWKYNLQFSNCEHFANWCETGKKENSQVSKAERVLERVLDPLGTHSFVDKIAEFFTGEKRPSVATPVLQLLNKVGVTRQQSCDSTDDDLVFLEKLSDSDLEPLYKILVYDKDGATRWTEKLSSSWERVEYGNAYSKYWKRIAQELQLFGGYTFANVWRGFGVPYKELLSDVCDKLDVGYSSSDPTVMLEEKLLLSVTQKALEKMSEADRRHLVETLDIPTTNFSPEVIIAILQAVIRNSGFKAYQLALTIVNVIWKRLFGAGIGVAASSTVGRAVSIFAGPIGWLFTAGWTAVELAGPAYRVTVPATVLIAMLRRKVQLPPDDLMSLTFNVNL